MSPMGTTWPTLSPASRPPLAVAASACAPPGKVPTEQQDPYIRPADCHTDQQAASKLTSAALRRRQGTCTDVAPVRDTTLPRFTTRVRGGWLTTASASDSASTKTISAVQPGASP